MNTADVATVVVMMSPLWLPLVTILVVAILEGIAGIVRAARGGRE